MTIFKEQGPNSPTESDVPEAANSQPAQTQPVARRKVEQIAAALQLPMSAFVAEHRPLEMIPGIPDASEALDLMQSFFNIADPEKRARVIELAKALEIGSEETRLGQGLSIEYLHR